MGTLTFSSGPTLKWHYLDATTHYANVADDQSRAKPAHGDRNNSDSSLPPTPRNDSRSANIAANTDSTSGTNSVYVHLI
jgi:hypothetical protein